jgi:hypothetical protein
VHARVALSLLRLLPHALRERFRIRTRRRVPDAEWRRLLSGREQGERRTS